MESLKILIVGVGGQGILRASKMIGNMFLSKGYDVKISEVHGMSQRGGSVVGYVSVGEKVYSPVIREGEADFILSFELLEAARWANYLKKGGTIITNTQMVNPMPVITGAESYPEDIVSKLQAQGIKIDAFDAFSIAEKAGTVKAVNIALLAKFSTYLSFAREEWEKEIEANVSERYRQSDMEAFRLGIECSKR